MAQMAYNDRSGNASTYHRRPIYKHVYIYNTSLSVHDNYNYAQTISKVSVMLASVSPRTDSNLIRVVQIMRYQRCNTHEQHQHHVPQAPAHAATTSQAEHRALYASDNGHTTHYNNIHRTKEVQRQRGRQGSTQIMQLSTGANNQPAPTYVPNLLMPYSVSMVTDAPDNT